MAGNYSPLSEGQNIFLTLYSTIIGPFTKISSVTAFSWLITILKPEDDRRSSNYCRKSNKYLQSDGRGPSNYCIKRQNGTKKMVADHQTIVDRQIIASYIIVIQYHA